MKDSTKTLLNKLYEFELYNSEPMQIDLRETENSCDMVNDVDYLERNDYIHKHQSYIGFLRISLTSKGKIFVENNFNSPSKTHQTTNFNFSGASIYNATIGNGNTVGSMIYNGSSALSEIEKIIAQQPLEHQATLNEMLDILREIQCSQEPVDKSRLTRFYDLVKKCSDLILPIGNFLFEVFFAPSR